MLISDRMARQRLLHSCGDHNLILAHEQAFAVVYECEWSLSLV